MPLRIVKSWAVTSLIRLCPNATLSVSFRRKLRGLRRRIRVPLSGTVQRSSLPVEARVPLRVDVAVSQRCPVRWRSARRLSLSLPTRLQRLAVWGRRGRRHLLGGTVRGRVDVPGHPRRRLRVPLLAGETGPALRAPGPGWDLRQRHGRHRRRRFGADRPTAGKWRLLQSCGKKQWKRKKI